MIKIDKNDSIVDIILKIKNCEDNEIILEFPFWHPVLHNYTSLKILKTKAWEKDLVINTNDKTSKRIWKKLGIKYNLITKAEIPDIEYSFWEYFLYTLKNYFKEAKIFITKKARENNFSKYQKLYTNGKVGFFAFFLLLSIWLLVFIFYFAVNKTYIHITPEIEVRAKWANFVFQVMSENDLTIDKNIVRLREIEKVSSLKTKVFTTWVDESGSSKASWKIKIQNFLEEDTYLVKNTRFVTDNGLVFLLDQEVKIPPMIIDNEWNKTPWELEATVTARVEDSAWKIIWTRGNIKSGVEFFLPWLKENEDKIKAISSSDFGWWTNSVKRILSKNDIENAKNILKTKLEEEWVKKIKEDLVKENKDKEVSYEILWADGMIIHSDFTFSWLENLKEWQVLDEFEISWSLKTKAYAFNKEIVLNKLKNIIKESTLANIENIDSIDEKSFRIVNEIWREKEPFRIKATAQIRAYYTPNFMSDKNNFIEKLKHQIAWMTKEEAEKVLINTWVVNSVDIQIRPFFIKNISKMVDNIKFEIN